ncbi:stage III sporulation protein AE [Clostridium hydrogenum]|uniref:stage III sporulation protein AE n=1 Tax=Clostridium hydrogenum TaxID=2855764 RepID=UPI001F412634|nr:stage III sporulation protein AE [Clostridium hydrogenum]
MKKIFVILIFISIFLYPLSVQASTDNNATLQNNDNTKVQQLYDYMSKVKTKYELLRDVDIESFVKEYVKSGNGGISFENLAKAMITYSVRDIVASIRLISMLIVICIICALLTNFQKAFSSESVTNIAYFACYSIIIIILARSFYSGVSEARSSIEDATNMMNTLVPVLFMLLAGTGNVVQSTLLDPVILIAISISSNIFKNILIPLITMIFVLQFVNSISEDYKVDQLSKLLKQVVLWIQGIVMTIFIGIITIRGINSKSIDQVTSKTAKYAVDNFVPVVGKCLSDAISTVVGYSGLVKNAIGTIGLIILIVMLLFPIIKIFILAFLHKLTAALVQPISDKRLVECIANVGDALILIASCVIGISVMFFIMIAIIIAAGKAY